MTSSNGRRGSARWKDVVAIIGITFLIVLLISALYLMWSLFGSTHHQVHQHNVVGPTPPQFSAQKELEELQKRVRQKERKLSIDVADALARNQLEYFTPVKVVPVMPLHEHDVLYGEDELWRANHPAAGLNLSQHNSGHFRHRDVHAWDPHPQYEFSAFGRHFRLELELNSEANFVSPKLRGYHVSPNASLVQPKPLHENELRCFYTGRVQGDAESMVKLSLCHGMTGYIYTSKGNFFVEPSEHWPTENSTDPISSPSVLHAMYTLSPSTRAPESRDANQHDAHMDDLQDSHCAAPHSDVESDDTMGTERLDFMNNTLNPYPPPLHRNKRSVSMGSFSKQLHIKVKVVTDRKMLEYHGDNLMSYVIILMNMVSKVFRDASIGNHININIVDFESRPDKQFYSQDSPWYTKYNTNSSDVWATEILKNFCEWQHQTKNTPDKNRNYDTAVLLTRENLCRYNNLSSCGTLGLAEVGAVCNPKKSCSIVQDNGLSAAFTIAHELGHVLNMKHDNDVACKRLMEPTGIHYMMAHMPGINTFPWAWSNCSRHYLTEFLEAGHGHCLEDKPEVDEEDDVLQRDQASLPGEHFDPNRQCAMLYGRGSKICTYMPKCGTLWCSREHVGKEGCISQFIPWADGTPCSHNKWCQRGSCVPINRAALKPRHGSWSSWGPWGECTRSCGGGIRQARRECDNPAPEHGGRYCIGERVKYESCETHDCPFGTRDFRESQCAKYNNAGEKKWTAKYFGSKPHEQCKLYCRGQFSDYHILFAEKVIDGTPCSPTSYDICVSGKCYAAGCDHRLGSTKTLDSCGVCDGDNTTCHVVTGTYNVSAPEYQRVVVIPAGSTNILIKQTSLPSHSQNLGVGDNIHLALRFNDSALTYILNGGYNVRPYHSRILDAGAPISYTGAKAEVEILNSTLEPIKLALVLEVFIVGKPVPPNIEYSYTTHYPYIWKTLSDWSECKNCIKTRSLSCVEQKTGRTVNKTFCINNSNHKKPDWHKPCNQHGCNYISKSTKCLNDGEKDKKFCKKHGWVFGNWTKCEGSCSNPGYQTRTVKCVNQKHRQVHHSYCEPLKTEDTRRPCTKSCSARWQASEWTPCSVQCGAGVRKRPLWCELEGRKVAERHCTQHKPVTHQDCFETEGCVGHWTTASTSQCSVSCGVGIIERQVICVLPTLNGIPAPDERACSSMSRPPDQVECSMPACNTQADLGVTAAGSTERPSIITENMTVGRGGRPPVGPHLQVAWIDELWSECSVSCGVGVKSRVVQCWELGQHQLLPDSVCEQLAPRPSVHMACSRTCGLWRPREWQPCSTSCGKGTMVRDVECEAEWARIPLPESACPSQERPASQTQCEGPPCPTDIPQPGDKKWATGSWGECTVSGKSGCGMGQKRRQVKCLHHTSCEGVPPSDTETCMLPCHDAMWNYGEWGRCTRPCGGGWKYRLVRCQSIQGAFLEEDSCIPSEKPTTREECHTHRCIGYRWRNGPWGQCSVSCGMGQQRRVVSCHRVSQLGWLESDEVHEENCQGLDYPASQQTCNLEPCSAPYHWSTGPWSQCSALCGKRGRQRRAVHCLKKDGTRAPLHMCNSQIMPNKRRKCNLRKCPGASTCSEVRFLLRGSGSVRDGPYVLTVLGRNVTLHCHDMTSHRPKEYLTLPSGEGENYSEFYHLSLRDPSTCPRNGVRWDECPCVPESKGLAGTTVFTKIRLNVHTMKVKTEDFTFARKIRGNRYIPYGEAGDCYSHTECPQGRFSVNLSGTPFRVSRTTGWFTNGSKGSMVQRSDDAHQKVWGKCGGMCGTCSPRKETGLKLDLVQSWTNSL